jgi:hypothetical protein
MTFGPSGKGSLGPSVLVRTENGLVRAADLEVGDVLLSLDVPGIPQNFTALGTTAEDLAALSWDTNVLASATPALTTITNISVNERTGATSVNGELFTNAHYLFIERDGVVKIVTVPEILMTDKVYNYNAAQFVDVYDLEALDVTYFAYSINCEPFDLFWTEKSLTFDNIQSE